MIVSVTRSYRAILRVRVLRNELQEVGGLEVQYDTTPKVCGHEQLVEISDLHIRCGV